MRKSTEEIKRMRKKREKENRMRKGSESIGRNKTSYFTKEKDGVKDKVNEVSESVFPLVLCVSCDSKSV